MGGLALLIGNASYEGMPSLRTPISDVRALADQLERCGFLTTTVENASLKRMNGAISEFAATISHAPAETSILFYFAGHGAQSEGENFLIPIDAGVQNDEWRLGSFRLSSLLPMLCSRREQPKFIVLDACRTNGIPSVSRSGALGLSGISTSHYETVSETMILYAARPGQVALDGGAAGSSPLCRAMIDAFGESPRSLVSLVPTIALGVENHTNGQQDAWFTGYVKRWADRPFWSAERQLAQTNSLIRLPGHAVAKPHNFASHEDAIVGGKAHLVHKLKAKDTTGRWAYYFVLVEEVFENAYLKAIEGDGIVDLESHGVVIASCYGESPTREVRQYLLDRYGWEV